jgi:type I restriction enzyme R subunit
LERVKALCEPVDSPKDTPAYTRYFCGDTENPEALKATEEKRVALYKHVSTLIRSYANIANEMPEAGYSSQEIERIKGEVRHYELIRAEIKLASGDYIDLKTYEPAMRHLIDTYIDAEESKKISSFDDMSLVELLVKRGVDGLNGLPEGIKNSKDAIAETIENNVRKVIIDEMPTNPKYFGKMSVLLDELIKERKAQARAYEEYLSRIVVLTKQVADPGSNTVYPSRIKTSAQRALYDNMEQDEERALALDDEIMKTRRDDWQSNIFKIREMKRAIRTYVQDDAELGRIFDLVKNQKEYR